MFAMKCRLSMLRAGIILFAGARRQASGVTPVVEPNTMGVCSEHCGNRSLSMSHVMIPSTLKVEKESRIYFIFRIMNEKECEITDS